MNGDLINESMLPPLLERFYDRVREDGQLGPVFEDAVHDWPAHIERLASFWSSVMLTSGKYKGNPVAAHMVHADAIKPEMFDRWLKLWAEVTNEMLTAAQAGAMQAKADRIAESLRLALKLRSPEGRNEMLGKPIPYSSSPEFCPNTLPTTLRQAHSTKPGVWGVINVLSGSIRYALEDGSEPVTLSPNRPGLIRPEERHHVEAEGDFRMRIDFYRAQPMLS